jgi:hypothetical protein
MDGPSSAHVATNVDSHARCNRPLLVVDKSSLSSLTCGLLQAAQFVEYSP